MFVVTHRRGTPAGEVALSTDAEGRFDCWAVEGDLITFACETASGKYFRFLNSKSVKDLDGSALELQLPEQLMTKAAETQSRVVQVTFEVIEPSVSQ